MRGPVAIFRTHPATRIAAVALLLASVAACKPDDMADQVKLKPYAQSAFYADGASARPLVPHTLAITDDIETPDLRVPAGINLLGRWQHPIPDDATFPFQITADDLHRGQQEFEIYCTPCHGQTGAGDGMIPQRGFIHPPTYHSARLRQAPVSYFYNVITEGVGAMFPYGQRVAPDDRWRIIAYIRTLQVSQHAAVTDLSAEDRASVAGGIQP